MKDNEKILTKPEKLADMLCKAIKRYTKARKQEKKNGLAVDSSRQKSVTVTVKIDKLENKNESI